MDELELKLLISEPVAREIWQRTVAAGLAASAPEPRLLDSTYFDTPSHSLRKARIALRLRKDGPRIIQTVKARASMHGGLSRVQEDEAEVAGFSIDPGAVADSGLARKIRRAAASGKLNPVCRTVVERIEAEVQHPCGTRAMMAVDHARISAGKRTDTLHELEIELVDGPPGGLFDIARDVLGESVFNFSQMSKLERGYLLAETGAACKTPATRGAANVALQRGQDVEEAAQLILRDCAAQVTANIEAVRHLDEPEAAHQLRVGLRRLRSALTVFWDIVGGVPAQHLQADARWLAGETGKVRDLDVITGQLLPQGAQLLPDKTGFGALAVMLAKDRDAAREMLRTEVLQPRVQAFQLDLMKFVETRGWRTAVDAAHADEAGVSIQKLASSALNKRWKKVSKRARHIEALAVPERHELRKQLKKLRYAAEFFEPLYPGIKTKPFIRRLRALQDLFGELNDAAMLELHLVQALKGANLDPAAAFAAGLMIGTSTARADMHWHRAQKLWRRLQDQPRFWV